LLFGAHDGIRRLVGETSELAYPVSGNGRLFEVENLLRDREGGLWIATSRHGLFHLHQGKADAFTKADGLSGLRGVYAFEDREGTIWISSSDGLDRFRDYTIHTFTTQQGLADSVIGSVQADRDGSVWVGTFSGLNQWNQGQFTTYGRG